MNTILLLCLSCVLILVSSEYRKVTCPLDLMFHCSVNETCRQMDISSTEGNCECKTNYKRLEGDGRCVREAGGGPGGPSPSPAPLHHTDSGNSYVPVGVWVVVACIAVGVVAGVGAVAARRGHWVERLHRLRLRTYNTVLVSSFTDDDQPIQ